ncbi:MAG TPA: carboxypeptidase regulatory-like domain-containing protein [Chloroflexia bacterium]|nr:carboxypeptidase regulatory-like domain-containing protein [Chloroflexia bacterium]
MSNVIASTRNSVRVLGLFAIMMAFAAMFAAGSASANTITPGSGSARVSAGTLIVSVVDAKSQEVVAGAEVEISNAKGQVVAKAVVGKSGVVEFKLAAGVYKMHVTAQDYQTMSAEIAIKSGQSSKTQVELQK